jgi:hypothetical protein
MGTSLFLWCVKKMQLFDCISSVDCKKRNISIATYVHHISNLIFEWVKPWNFLYKSISCCKKSVKNLLYLSWKNKTRNGMPFLHFFSFLTVWTKSVHKYSSRTLCGKAVHWLRVFFSWENICLSLLWGK